MVNNDDFEQLLTDLEKVAWNAVKMGTTIFFVNTRAGNYKKTSGTSVSVQNTRL